MRGDGRDGTGAGVERAWRGGARSRAAAGDDRVEPGDGTGVPVGADGGEPGHDGAGDGRDGNGKRAGRGSGALAEQKGEASVCGCELRGDSGVVAGSGVVWACAGRFYGSSAV